MSQREKTEHTLKLLPKFIPTSIDKADTYIRAVLKDNKTTDDDFVENLEMFEAGYFRVIFDGAYFNRDYSPPSRSQWNTLKKKMKRHNPLVFIFKEYGTFEDGNYFLDFGFLSPRND